MSTSQKAYRLTTRRINKRKQIRYVRAKPLKWRSHVAPTQCGVRWFAHWEAAEEDDQKTVSSVSRPHLSFDSRAAENLNTCRHTHLHPTEWTKKMTRSTWRSLQTLLRLCSSLASCLSVDCTQGHYWVSVPRAVVHFPRKLDKHYVLPSYLTRASSHLARPLFRMPREHDRILTTGEKSTCMACNCDISPWSSTGNSL